MKTYPTYKDSGISWIGQIPEHWEVVPFGRHFTFAKGLPITKADLIQEGVAVISYGQIHAKSNTGLTISDELIRYVDSKFLDTNPNSLLKYNDFVFADTSEDIAGIGNFAYNDCKYDIFAGYHTIIARPIGLVFPKFYACLFSSLPWKAQIQSLVNGVKVYSLGKTHLKKSFILIPPLSEQQKIVEYIEGKTQKIDACISEREKQKQLLSELKQRVIADAVTRGLNPNATMKDSGISWIGQIPEHWEVKRLASLFTDDVKANSDFAYKHAFKFNYGTLVPKNEIGDAEENRETYVKYSVLKENDIVINGLNLNYDFISQRVAIAPKEGIITSAYLVARPRKTTFPAYYLYLLKTMDNKKMFHGMGTGIRLTLSFDELKKQMLPLPPLSEQQKIVEYIEGKTQKIDACILEREKQLQLLSELKQRVIADAVTRGLNPNATMKDSGISWIGQIPEHWEVKRLSQVTYEHFISNKEVHHQNLLSLSYGKIIRKDINTTNGLLPSSFDTYQIVEPGNIILRLTDLQNDHRSLRVGLVKEEGIITSAYVCVGINDTQTIIPTYLYTLLHTYDIWKLFYSMGGGIRQGLNWDGLKKIDIILPPLSEQEAIVAYIDQKCEKINAMVADIEKEINYLKEYKQRLIADAVTGAINVQ